MTIDPTPKVYDEVDYQIMLALSRDARMSSAKVAKELGINERTAHRRLDNLMESGAIRISAICEPSAFGYNNIVDVNLTVEDGALETTVKALNRHAAVCYLSQGLGEHDMTVQARFKSGEEINQFLYTFLKGLSGVEIKNFYFEARILQDIDTWLPTEKDFIKSSRISTKLG